MMMGGLLSVPARISDIWVSAIWLLAISAGLFSPAGASVDAPAPSMEARKQALLDYLSALRAEGGFIAGTQVNEYEVSIACDSMDRLVAMTGEEQAVLGLELMFAQSYPHYEDALIAHARAHAERGGVVTLAWHQRNPLRVCPRGEFYDCSKTPMSAAALTRMLTPGTPEHGLWLADVDAAAATLRRFQEAGIIVLFRPYHEMNGGWFWWGDKDAYPQLWDALFDAMENRHGLENIIWVWSGDRAIRNARRYWPEKHPPDATGTDVYENRADAREYYAGARAAAKLAPGLPFGFTEVGRAPSDRVLRRTRPAWVLIWGGEYLNADWAQADGCAGCNSAGETRAFFQHDGAVSLNDMPMEVRRLIAGGAPSPDPERPACPASLLETGDE